MWIWIVPLVVSYAIFTFVAEHINPFKSFREDVPRRRMKSGRRIGFIALISCYFIAFSSQFLLPLFNASSPDESIDVKPLVQTESNIAVPETETVPNTEFTSQVGAETTSNLLSEKQTNTSTNRLGEQVITVDVSEYSNWIRTQNPRHNTIQMTNSIDRSSVESFLEQNQLPEPNAIFAYDRNGTTWYALIHGSFESLSDAEAALAQLPEQTKSINPWVRRFENIQPIIQ